MRRGMVHPRAGTFLRCPPTRGEPFWRTVMKARIGVVGDHPATVLGLTSILNVVPSLHVVAAAPTAAPSPA